MKKVRIIPVLLTILIICQSIIFPVYAQTANTKNYEYQIDGVQVSIQYTLTEDVLSEIITVSDGVETHTIRKDVLPSGLLYVYYDGAFLYEDIISTYDDYLYALTYNEDTVSVMPQTYANRLCGINYHHMHVENTYYTIDIALHNLTEAAVLSILFTYFDAPGWLAAGAGILTGVAQYISNNNIDYIDVTEAKYFVSDVEMSIAMNCYHSVFVYYNLNQDNTRDVVKIERKYHQYLL